MKHLFTTDASYITKKPTKEEIEEIYYNFGYRARTSISMFPALLEQTRIVYSPAAYKGFKKNANWVSQSWFILDFDNNQHYTEILKETELLGLKPNIIYETMSHTEQTLKYRFLYFINKVITDKDERDYLQKALMALYKHPDKSCKDAARLWFPHKQGSNIMLLSDKEIDYIFFKSVLDTAVIKTDKNQTRKLKNFNSDFKYEETKIIEKFDFQKAKKIKIFNDFLEYKRLKHMQIFGLATSLIHVKGGLKMMKETMDKVNELNNDKYDDHGKPMFYIDAKFDVLRVVQKFKYAPMNLKNYSPYKEDFKYINLLSLHYKKKKNTVEVIEPINTITLRVAEKKLKDGFEKALKTDSKIVLIKAMPALGKTKLLENMHHNAVLAFPTHKLKNEVSQRLKYPHVVTPDQLIFNETNINERLKFYYYCKNYKKASALLRLIASNKHHTYNNITDAKLAQEYLNALEIARNTKETIVTTHSRAIHNAFDNHDTIIFDEDPILNHMIEIDEINIGDLFGICGELGAIQLKFNELKIAKKELEIMPVTELIESVAKEGLLTKLEPHLKNNTHPKINLVVKLINSSYFYIKKKKVFFGSINTDVLQKAKKIIIMSASANQKVYEKVFGSDLEVVDITNVKIKGRIKQDVSFSFSKSMKKIDYLKFINDKYPDHKTLGHKDSLKELDNVISNIYFFNNAGYDELKNDNLKIIGTPHLPKEAYLLIGAIIGYNIDNATYREQVIIHNGIKFKMMTFDDPQLRQLQLNIIEGELLQLVHRSRVLRNDNEILLFSNFPLVNAEYVDLFKNMNKNNNNIENRKNENRRQKDRVPDL